MQFRKRRVPCLLAQSMCAFLASHTQWHMMPAHSKQRGVRLYVENSSHSAVAVGRQHGRSFTLLKTSSFTRKKGFSFFPSHRWRITILEAVLFHTRPCLLQSECSWMKAHVQLLSVVATTAAAASNVQDQNESVITSWWKGEEVDGPRKEGTKNAAKEGLMLLLGASRKPNLMA